MPYSAGGGSLLVTEGYDDLGEDQLGFSLRRTFSNVSRAVTKGVRDIGAEANRARKNPLVQAGVSLVPGAAAFTVPAAIASRIAQGQRIANTVQSVRRKISSGDDAVDAVATGVEELAPGSTAARTAKAARGRVIQARNRIAAAEKKAADDAAAAERRAAKVAQGKAIRAAAADKRAADEKAAAERRAAKVAEGRRIRAKREADARAAEAAKLEQDAIAAAAAGREADAARIRDQAAAAADQSRQAAAVANAAPVYSAPVQSGPVPADSYAAQAGGVAPAQSALSSIPTPVLVGGVAVLGVAVMAMSRGGGSHRDWR